MKKSPEEVTRSQVDRRSLRRVAMTNDETGFNLAYKRTEEELSRLVEEILHP